MDFGIVAIWVAFLAAAVATFTYYTNARRLPMKQKKGHGERSVPVLANRAFALMVAAAIAASALMFYYLLTHQFQYTYVYRYSSRDLPVLYLISAFWAGQEGTFLLWALLVGLMGLVFKSTVKVDGGYGMAIVSAFSAFLFLLMLVKSPFDMYPVVPPDGAGLNPLLQDPWMAVHPPILFVGYAAVTFPFALVISALVRRKYLQWVSVGFTWTLFSAVMLGAGIIIGGFWAYEVLGWGGYWGWDPVENSSLVPWLTLLALFHGLVVQKFKGSLVRTNIFLAILTFVLVIYATFLTRSGVLADFSVHSFVDLGINNYLIAAMIISAGGGLGLFARRFREIQAPHIDMSTLNREFALTLSLMALCVVALFTFVGMSSPILTGLFGNPSQVDISFYDKVNLPVAIIIALLLGVTPFLGWVEKEKTAFLKRLALPMTLTVISGIIAFLVGVRSIVLFLFVITAAFALWSNILTLIRQVKLSWLHAGAPLSHIGVALMLIGIIGSGSFDDSRHLVLKPGEPQSAFGHTFTFQGASEGRAKKTQMNIEVSDGRSTYLATPKLYYSEYNRAVMREPDIKILPLKDLYISPIEIRSSAAEHSHPMLELAKDEQKEIEGYQVKFVRFETAPHMETGAMAVGAVLNVNAHGKDHIVTPVLSFDERGEPRYLAADLPALQLPTKGVEKPQVVLVGLSVEERKVVLQFNGLDDHSAMASQDALIIDVSTKPLMLVVWSGVVFLLLGIVIAWRKRVDLIEQ